MPVTLFSTIAALMLDITPGYGYRAGLEQFQQKCEAVLRPELRKEQERQSIEAIQGSPKML